MKTISVTNAPAAIGPYSQGVIVGDLVFLSGSLAIEPTTGEFQNGDVAVQTELAISNISAVLAGAGLTLQNVIKTTCFLTDMNDFPRFNEVYGKHFAHKPARSTVAVKALPKGAIVEIEVIATKSN